MLNNINKIIYILICQGSLLYINQIRKKKIFMQIIEQ